MWKYFQIVQNQIRLNDDPGGRTAQNGRYIYPVYRAISSKNQFARKAVSCVEASWDKRKISVCLNHNPQG